MLATAPSTGSFPPEVMTPVLLCAVAGLGLWLVVLTAFVVRRRREPWRDDGRPVFQRLPDGRTRFSWGVAQDLARVQRLATARHVTARHVTARHTTTERRVTAERVHATPPPRAHDQRAKWSQPAGPPV